MLVPVTTQWLDTFQNDHQVKWLPHVTCIPLTEPVIPTTHLFCNWKFVPSNLSHLFVSSTTAILPPVCPLYV